MFNKDLRRKRKAADKEAEETFQNLQDYDGYSWEDLKKDPKLMAAWEKDVLAYGAAEMRSWNLNRRNR